jgi:hypothetical protein
MGESAVIIFRPYPFEVGQKVYIEDGPRQGDWEVVAVSDRKVTLRCPFSKREFAWNRFCYFNETREDIPWPHPE